MTTRVSVTQQSGDIRVALNGDAPRTYPVTKGQTDVDDDVVPVFVNLLGATVVSHGGTPASTARSGAEG
jgi:hypothetical protein